MKNPLKPAGIFFFLMYLHRFFYYTTEQFTLLSKLARGRIHVALRGAGILYGCVCLCGAGECVLLCSLGAVAPSLLLLPCPLPGPGHYIVWSSIHIVPYLPGSLVTAVWDRTSDLPICSTAP